MTEDEIESRVSEGFEANSRGEYKLSISILESTRKIIESESSPSNALQVQYCILLNYLSSAYRKTGDGTNALETALLGTAEFEKLSPESFEDLQYMYADNCNNAANVLADAERLDEAVYFLDKAIHCEGPKLLFINNRAQICLAFNDIDLAKESLCLVFSLNIADKAFGSNDQDALYNQIFRIVQTVSHIQDSTFTEKFLSRLELEIERSFDFLSADSILGLHLDIANAYFYSDLIGNAVNTTSKGLNYFVLDDIPANDITSVFAALKLNHAIFLGAAGNSQVALDQIEECLQLWGQASTEDSFEERFKVAQAIRFLEMGKIERMRGNNEEAACAFMNAWVAFPQRENEIQITYAKAVSRIHLGELLLENSQNQEAKASFMVSDMLLSRRARDNQINFDLELVRSTIGLARCEVRQFQHSEAEKHLLNATEIAARHAQDPRFQDVQDQLVVHQRALEIQIDTEKPQDATSTKGPWGEPSIDRVPQLRIDTSNLSRPLGFENFTVPDKWPIYGIAFFTIASVLFALILPNLLYKLGVFVLSILFWVTFATCYSLYSTNPWTRISKISLNLDSTLGLSPTTFLERRVERTGEQDELEDALNQISLGYSSVVVALAILAFGWILGNFLVFYPGPGFETLYSAAFFFGIQGWGPLAILIVRVRVFSKHPNGKLVLRPKYHFVVRRVFQLLKKIDKQIDKESDGIAAPYVKGLDVIFTRPCTKLGLGKKYVRFRFPWLTIAWFCLSTALMILSYPILLLTVMVWIAWPEVQANM